MIPKSLPVFALVAALAACSSTNKSPGAGGGDAGGDDAGMPAGDGGVESFTVTFGPIQVPPSTENTQCITVRLGNPTPIHVGQIHDLLGDSSHHMILYKVSDTTEQKTPIDCRPFTDTLNPAKGNPLIISQKKDDTLALPQGVAYTLDANQMVRLEMHYINATTSTVTLETSSTLTTLPDSEYKNDASFVFVGDLDISLPPMSNATLGPIFFPMPSQFANANFFAITGHEHQLGTKVQVWSAQNANDTGKLEYTSTMWSDPVTTHYDPPLQFPNGSGFKYQCDWYNGTTSTVTFGESANDEMCFFWAYYWPSQGAQVCFHTANYGGVDVCCPGSSQLCASLGN